MNLPSEEITCVSYLHINELIDSFQILLVYIVAATNDYEWRTGTLSGGSTMLPWNGWLWLWHVRKLMVTLVCVVLLTRYSSFLHHLAGHNFSLIIWYGKTCYIYQNSKYSMGPFVTGDHDGWVLSAGNVLHCFSLEMVFYDWFMLA